MKQFGLTSSFNSERYYHTILKFNNYFDLLNTCRCETFNSFIHMQNIFGNKMAPSRNIANIIIPLSTSDTSLMEDMYRAVKGTLEHES